MQYFYQSRIKKRRIWTLHYVRTTFLWTMVPYNIFDKNRFKIVEILHYH